jgi:hypothetical protein
MKKHNKVDEQIKRTGNKIDEAVNEVATSDFVRVLVRWLVSAAGACIVFAIVMLIITELLGILDDSFHAIGWVIAAGSFFVFNNLLKQKANNN